MKPNVIHVAVCMLQVFCSSMVTKSTRSCCYVLVLFFYMIILRYFQVISCPAGGALFVMEYMEQLKPVTSSWAELGTKIAKYIIIITTYMTCKTEIGRDMVIDIHGNMLDHADIQLRLIT